MEIKQELLNYCWEYVNQRLSNLTKAFEEVRQATFEETKSSVGDKHETSRAMMQLEQEKLSAQLAELGQFKQVLGRIKIEETGPMVGEGSLVLTRQANYFIGISAGKHEIGGKIYYLVSQASPIGEVLAHHKAGDTFNFRSQTIEILEVI